VTDAWRSVNWSSDDERRDGYIEAEGQETLCLYKSRMPGSGRGKRWAAQHDIQGRTGTGRSRTGWPGLAGPVAAQKRRYVLHQVRSCAKVWWSGGRERSGGRDRHAHPPTRPNPPPPRAAPPPNLGRRLTFWCCCSFRTWVPSAASTTAAPAENSRQLGGDGCGLRLRRS